MGGMAGRSLAIEVIVVVNSNSDSDSNNNRNGTRNSTGSAQIALSPLVQPST